MLTHIQFIFFNHKPTEIGGFVSIAGSCHSRARAHEKPEPVGIGPGFHRHGHGPLK
jgi:hypothetical protein